MKRKDLPGFYWDDVRQRYFPISNRPPARPQNQSSESKSTDTPPFKGSKEATQISDGNYLNSMAYAHTRVLRNNSLRFSQVNDIRSRLRAGSIATFCTKGQQCLSLFDTKYLSFRVTEVNKQQCLLTGDNRGRFTWSFRDPTNRFSQFASYGPQTQQLVIGNEVKHVLNWKSHVIGIGTGASCSIFVTDISTESEAPFILRLDKTLDVFSASLSEDTFAIGTRDAVKVIEGLYTPVRQARWNRLHCGSDVMAVSQHNNTILAGCRNGTVQLFDIRDTKTRGTHLLDDRFHRKSQRFIAHIKVIRDWELLISTSAGDLEMFDLRYSASATPITTYKGHVNSVRSDLGIDIDPSNEFVFAAGEDLVVRGWSLKSGMPLRNQKSGTTDLLREFKVEEEITCLQVTEDSDGLRLWAASGDMIRSFNLGIAGEDISLHGLDDNNENRVQY